MLIHYTEQIAAQADKIAHLPDVKCNCSGCLNTPTYLNEQLTNIYAQLNAQNKLIQEQSNIQTVILKELIPLLKEIDAKLSK